MLKRRDSNRISRLIKNCGIEGTPKNYFEQSHLVSPFQRRVVDHRGQVHQAVQGCAEQRRAWDHAPLQCRSPPTTGSELKLLRRMRDLVHALFAPRMRAGENVRGRYQHCGDFRQRHNGVRFLLKLLLSNLLLSLRYPHSSSQPKGDTFPALPRVEQLRTVSIVPIVVGALPRSLSVGPVGEKHAMARTRVCGKLMSIVVPRHVKCLGAARQAP